MLNDLPPLPGGKGLTPACTPLFEGSAVANFSIESLMQQSQATVVPHKKYTKNALKSYHKTRKKRLLNPNTWMTYLFYLFFTNNIFVLTSPPP